MNNMFNININNGGTMQQASEHNDNRGKDNSIAAMTQQFQGGNIIGVNNNMIPPQNSIINTAPATNNNNNMSVFPQQASSQIVYQVKTGESVNNMNNLQPYFVNNKYIATVPQQLQQQHGIMGNNTFNHNGSSSNSNSNFRSNQSSSATLLDLEKQLADAYAKSNMLMNEINNNNNSNKGGETFGNNNSSILENNSNTSNDNNMNKDDFSSMLGGT